MIFSILILTAKISVSWQLRVMMWTTVSTYDVSQTPFQFNFSGLDYIIDISNGIALKFLIFKLSFVTDVFILTD